MRDAPVSISLDHPTAKRILLEEAERAAAGELTDPVGQWRDRVERLGELCPHRKSATVIAALGTALLAKATDDRVDVYSLLDRSEGDNSYSARSLADNVWAKNRARLGVDLGANGVNPLNNTPFIGKTRIDEITGVRNREGWDCFMETMEAVRALPSSDDARQALRGFILARSRSLLQPIDVEPDSGDDLTETDLAELITSFVRENSEGGRRAQACAAGLLDATFGEAFVSVGVVNDPDRRAPLDISIVDEDGDCVLAFEVKDKPIADHHVVSSIEKTAHDHDVRNLVFVAVAPRQTQRDFGDTIRWAARHGVRATVFFDWLSLLHACKLASQDDGSIFEGVAFRRLLARGHDQGIDGAVLDALKRAAAEKTQPPPPAGA